MDWNKQSIKREKTLSELVKKNVIDDQEGQLFCETGAKYITFSYASIERLALNTNKFSQNNDWLY